MFGAIAGGIASALAGGAMSKLFGGGQKAASGGIQGDVLATDNNTVDRKSGSAGMPRPSSYAVFCLKKKNPFAIGVANANAEASSGLLDRGRCACRRGLRDSPSPIYRKRYWRRDYSHRSTPAARTLGYAKSERATLIPDFCAYPSLDVRVTAAIGISDRS